MSRFTPARLVELIVTLALTAWAVALATQPHAEEAGIRAEKPWVLAPVRGNAIAAGYVTLENRSRADRLVTARSPEAAAVEIHDMSMAGGTMRMRRLEGGAPVPDSGALRLEPHGMHLMLIGLKSELKAGDVVPITLMFEKAGEVAVDFPVLTSAPK